MRPWRSTRLQGSFKGRLQPSRHFVIYFRTTDVCEVPGILVNYCVKGLHLHASTYLGQSVENIVSVFLELYINIIIYIYKIDKCDTFIDVEY